MTSFPEKISIQNFGFYQNCRSIKISKLKQFQQNANNFNYIFVTLTETWLTDNESNCDLGLNNYIIYRCDRKSRRGGGVLIAIRKDISSYELPMADVIKGLETKFIKLEQLFVKFVIGSANFIISNVYIPNQSCEVYKYHMKMNDKIIKEYPGHHLIFIGDYNLPKFNWNDYDNDRIDFRKTNIELHVPQIFKKQNFFQVNRIPNDFGKTLDLIFNNFKSLEAKQTKPVVEKDSHHPPLCISLVNLSPIPN